MDQTLQYNARVKYENSDITRISRQYRVCHLSGKKLYMFPHPRTRANILLIPPPLYIVYIYIYIHCIQYNIIMHLIMFVSDKKKKKNIK